MRKKGGEEISPFFYKYDGIVFKNINCSCLIYQVMSNKLDNYDGGFSPNKLGDYDGGFPANELGNYDGGFSPNELGNYRNNMICKFLK